MSFRFGIRFAASICAAILAAQITYAQTDPAAEPQVKRGAVTNLPIPRFVSLKGSEGNVRRGPSLRHRIDWVFTQRGMPLRVIGEFEHWRQVQDRDGVGGWVHYSLLSGARTAIVDQDLTPLYSRADPDSQINAYLEAGVIARIENCGPVWCRLKADGIRGWTTKDTIWGVGPDEEIK
ncbi:SH3 domain-containing protein [Aliiroseovarius marinus]|uniref:SH3 domain-containing protein n=1 Tax=Aliiroseovarius marinus TaxID=2500159 RepID=UPI00105B8C29